MNNKKIVIGLSGLCIAGILGGGAFALANNNNKVEPKAATETTQLNDNSTNDKNTNDSNSVNTDNTNSNSNNSNNKDNNTNNNDYITAEKAQSIAIEHANLADSKLDYIKCDLDVDNDDNEHTYEIEFAKDNVEYEYEVDAISSEILNFSTENQKNNSNADSTAKYIGSTKAKSIALEHAKVSSSDAEYIKCTLDNDDSVDVYEIEFRKDNVEYDYEINAETGDLLDYSVEKETNNN